MDANKALQAIREGDLYAMAAALDFDESMEIDLPLPEGMDRLRAYRVGMTVLTVYTPGTPGDGSDDRQMGARLASLGSVEEAQQRFHELVQHAQTQRAIVLMVGGKHVGDVRVNGVEVPAPTVSVMPIPIYDSMIDAQVSMVTVPDDASALDDTV